jgi:hypothetical protein
VKTKARKRASCKQRVTSRTATGTNVALRGLPVPPQPRHDRDALRLADPEVFGDGERAGVVAVGGFLLALGRYV